jgi:hypothetical protein
MSASKHDIRDWLKEAKRLNNCTHLVVVLDTYENTNFPVFIFTLDNVVECVKILQDESSMQSVDEVYNMSIDTEQQLSASHVWNM